MNQNKTIKLLMGVSLLLAAFSIGLPNALALNEDNIINTNTNSSSRPVIETYETQEGSTNTIYWLPGLDNMPKMTSDKELQNTNGYFNVSYDSGYYTYNKEYIENQGYYDLNKNDKRRSWMDDPQFGMISENNLCYLSSATNLLHWWFDQNKEYINKYIERLQDKTLIQPDGLVDLSNPDLFFKMMEKPLLQLVDGHYRQELKYSNIAWPTFGSYFTKKEGFFSDKVWDFFFNGYPKRDSTAPNKEASYTMDKDGGFFYPIFQQQLLTSRLQSGNYVEISNYIKENLEKGNGLALYYFVSKGDASHALTLWGAEFDSNDLLTRVYVTNSDDTSEAIYNQKNLVGIYGLDVHKDAGGLAHLGNNGANASKNNLVIQGLSSLSLGQDIFKAVLNDTGDVEIPTIENDLIDYSYQSYNENTAKALEVKATTTDTGKLSYQWYEASSLNDEGTPIMGATNNSYKPKLDYGNQTKYYYCLITNTKQGKSISIKSRYSKITVDSSLIDAKAPIINSVTKPKLESPNNRPYVFENTNPGLIRVDASSIDNGTISYQWYIKDYYDSGFSKIAGATNSYLVPETTGSTKTYRCLVTNTNNSATGSKTYSVNAIDLKIELVENNLLNTNNPYLIDAPTTINATLNESTKIDIIAATGDGGSITYQWYSIDNNGNEKRLNGETNNSLSIKPLTTESLKYRCEITNFNDKASKNKYASIKTDIITINVNDTKEFDGEVKTSLVISYDSTSLIPSKINLRFGYQLNTADVDLNSFEYGMILLSKDDVNRINSLDTITLDILNDLKKDHLAIAIPPKNLNNGISQYAWVVNNITENRYSFEFVACAYKINLKENKIILSKKRVASVLSTKDIYIAKKDELKLSDEIIKVLNNIK